MELILSVGVARIGNEGEAMGEGQRRLLRDRSEISGFRAGALQRAAARIADIEKTPQHRSVGGFGGGPCNYVHFRCEATNRHIEELALHRGELLHRLRSSSERIHLTYRTDTSSRFHLAIGAVSFAFVCSAGGS